MSKQVRSTLILGLAALTSVGSAGSQTAPTPVESVVATRHRIAIQGRTLGYTARAGQLPIRDHETGEVLARIFFVSYTLDRAAGTEPRPLLFYWNGGPGSSAAQTYLLGLGPRIAAMGDDFATTTAISETRLVDNDATLLAAADLVFVDPVGTGYSRVVRPELADRFYQVRGDAESIAEFIRVYRIRFDALEAPLYIGGESYGTTRAANVALVLARRRIPVRGAVLAALATPIEPRPLAIRTALQLPSYTAAAHYWKKLAPELQADRGRALAEAERWAGTEYVRALSRVDSLSEAERREVIDRVARYSGLERAMIDPKTLAVDDVRFVYDLVRDRGLLVGLYETRRAVAWNQAVPTEPDPFIDPGLVPQLPYMNGTAPALLRYLREELGYRSDLSYQGPFGGGYPSSDAPRGDWASARWVRNAGEAAAEMIFPVDGKTPPLREAMELNPDLMILVQCGYHDLICHYYENVWAIERLAPELRRRFTVRTYQGGHEAYLTRVTRLAMQRDLARFVDTGRR